MHRDVMKQHIYSSCAISFLIFVKLSLQCKILVTSDGMSSSHLMFHYRVAETLAVAGLDVTLSHAVANPSVKIKDPHPKLKYWKHRVSDDLSVHDQMAEDVTETAFKQDKFDWNMISRLKDANVNTCQYQLNNSKLMSDLRDAKFDIVFGHMTDYCWLGWVHLLNISSFVWMSEGLLLDMFTNYLRLPGPPSHVPHAFQSFTDDMNMKERTVNALAAATTPFIANYFMDPVNEIFRNRFGSDFPDLGSLLPKSKLVVINSEEYLDYPRAVFHKILYVGGLGIEEPKPLKDKWKRVMENTNYKGTVLFSMGSVAKASKIPKHVRIAFANAFKRFPNYQFIMKLDETFPEAADAQNIHIAEWVPQADLLGHPNLVAFITHGGWNSVLESTRAGIPMIVIPLFADQHGNMKRVEKRGLGFGLDKLNLTEQNIYQALDEILNNAIYRTNAKKLSRMIKKKPVKPTELLINWTNFLCEFGSNFTALQPMATELTFTEHYLVDALAIAIISIMVIACIAKYFGCLFARRCYQTTAKPKQS